LNKRWITNNLDPTTNKSPVFPFVLTGQTIDRELYDHLNSYTGELGSDGVVRVAAANLNATYIKLVQDGKNSELVIDKTATAESWPMAFALIRGVSHSGEDKGILRSIKDDGIFHPTVSVIINCLRVNSSSNYSRLSEKFARLNESVLKKELVEIQKRGFLSTREFIHDQSSMVIVRLRDDQGYPITDFDFLLMGKKNDPDRLPEGFFIDRQANSRDRSILTFFLNYTLMVGSPKIPDPQKKRKTLREETEGIESLGVSITPRPEKGFVHYKKATLRAQKRLFEKFLDPNQTTMVDIVLQRVVRAGTFQLQKADSVDPKGVDFSKQPLGTKIPDAKKN